ncbi:MAG: discoidin domain-containing protein [Clostridia bacterium]|nr:discoidin domain-containing protein [Clostridia bacterium]
MKSIKRITALALCAALMVTMLPAMAFAKETNIIMSEPFDGVPTNSTSDKITVTGAKTRTIDMGNQDKAMQILPGQSTSVKALFDTSAKKYIISLDISADSRIDAKITISAGNSESALLLIKDNVITTSIGKRITGINSNTFTRISVALNKKSNDYTLYVNGKPVLSDWDLPSTAVFDSFTVTRDEKMTESMYLDNLIVYEGEELMKNLPGGTYSADGIEFVDITDDLGDFSFFKSNYITHRYVGYPNTTFVDQGNEIICEKFDYQNADKGDRIIFKKNNSSDCYMNITAKIFTTYRSSKVYKNFKLSGDFMCDFEGDGSANIFFMRDSITTGSNIDLYPVRVNEDGSITLFNGKVIYGVAAKGKWFNITMYANLEDHVLTLFVDGEKVLENVKIKEEMENLSFTRVQVRSGDFTGEMQCRNMEFTGLDKPYNGEEIYTSMFSSDEPIEDYLADKICFHYYGENIWSQGAKSLMTAKPVYENGEIYVSAEDFNRAYGKNVVFDGSSASLDGKSITFAGAHKDGLVPVRETAEKLLGCHTFDDTNGFIITSLKPIYFDASKEIPYHKREIHTGYINRLSTLQYIYDYMLFDRPDKEYLLEGFNKATNNGEVHPRVMADADDFARIREQYKTDEYMKLVVDSIISQADGYCNQEPIFYKYDDALRTLVTANRLRDRMFAVGLAYQITGDKKYADCAWANLNALNDFPDMNAGHPIDTGSYGTGVAIGYDWCYDAFTPEQRENIEMNAKRLHLTVIHDGFYGRSPVRGGNDGNINVVGYYNKWISNYNAWTNSGSILMSIAFMDTYPEICSDLLAHCIRSMEYTFKNLYPDGAWVESTNYWTIVAHAMAQIFPALQTIYGTDFNLSRFPGTEVTGITNMALRSMFSTYNYHDAGPEEAYANFPMAFMGKYFNHPELLAARRGTLTKAYDSRMKAQSAHTYDALFYDPDVMPEQIEAMPKMTVAKGLELFAVHKDYTDYDGLVFAAHGGPVEFYHSHYDVGDFVLDMNGQRWAYSLPAEDYNSSLSGSEKYRMRTEGHNTVSINNGQPLNQQGKAYAPIIASEEGSGGAYAVYDMSDVYADVSDYKRGFYIDDNFSTVTVRDEIELSKNNSEIYWFMHTQANAEIIDDHTAILSANGKSLAVNFETSAKDFKLEIMDAVPLPTSPEGKGQNPNSGICKVAIRIVSSGKVDLTVRMSELPGVVDTTPIAQWTAPEATAENADTADYSYNVIMNGEKFENLSYIPVLDTSSLPEFIVEAADPAMHAELEKSDTLTKSNIIRVYNADRTNYKIYIVPYSTVLGVKELVYDEVEITDFSVSSEPEVANIGKNMLDNDFSTRWTTLNTGEQAVFDLGSVKTVDGIAAGFWQSGVRKYNIDLYSSVDGENWTFINSYISETAPEEYQIFKFDTSLNARYIKLIGQGNSVNVNTNILEFRALRLKEAFR